MPPRTEPVAENHYLQVTDAHFVRAVVESEKQPEHAAQNPGAVSGGNGRDRSGSHSRDKRKSPAVTERSDVSRYLHDSEVAATGLEPVTRGL